MNRARFVPLGSRSSTRPVAAAVLALGALVSLVSCSSSSGSSSASGARNGNSSGQSRTVTIGFSPFNQSATALVELGKNAKAYAESQGANFRIADPNNSATTQVQQTTAWIQNGQIEALWLFPNSTSAMRQVIKLAQQKGVVVVGNGGPKDYGYSGPQPGVSFSTLDYGAYGAGVADTVADCADARLGGSGKAILTTAAPGQPGVADIVSGFKQELAKKAPNVQIVSEVNPRGNRQTAQQVVSSALQAHPDATILAGIDDAGVLGGMSAFKSADRDVTKSCLAGAGGGPETVKEVKSRQIYATVALDFESDLKQTIDLLLKMARDPKAVGVVHTTPLVVTTK